MNICKLSFFHLMIWVRFPFVHLTTQFFFKLSFCLLIFLWFLAFFTIDFDSYYIVWTDEGQPRPKYLFNKCGTNIYFFYSREVRSPSPNFKEKKTDTNVEINKNWFTERVRMTNTTNATVCWLISNIINKQFQFHKLIWFGGWLVNFCISRRHWEMGFLYIIP